MPKQRRSRRRSPRAAPDAPHRVTGRTAVPPPARDVAWHPGGQRGIAVLGASGGVPGCWGGVGAGGAVPRWLLLARGCGGARMLIPSLWQRGIKVTGTSVTAEYVPGGGRPRAPPHPPLGSLFPPGPGFGAPTSALLTPRLPQGDRRPPAVPPPPPPAPGTPGTPRRSGATAVALQCPRVPAHVPLTLSGSCPPPPGPRQPLAPARARPGPPSPLIKLPPPRRSRGSRVAPKWV